MKIREIEFNEKLLIKVDAGRSTYKTVTGKIAARWWVDLTFGITDDFDFEHIDKKSVEYIEFDFENSEALDDYIKALEKRLNQIIVQNGK